ncbi:DUF1493 family protein [Sediminitomix flava]|uniref:Uncharacterized protein DUF1493 n=1 Tax=Sediminitomix flava TaxID=379075 RepID=A0A315YR44_SEDFL|nr:DUF1493 family protein [Sediminitomix flava]PWJ30950.1 uncharacterized protein DUF1493 [Sediminitomix flava]
MKSVDDVIILIKKYAGTEEVYPDTDINKDLNIYGDDFNDLLEEYSVIADVDMSEFLWYFHYKGEGWNFGDLIFRPPNKRVKRIKLTPQILYNFTLDGKWGIKYPKHSVPSIRYDIIGSVIVCAVLIILIFLNLK